MIDKKRGGDEDISPYQSLRMGTDSQFPNSGLLTVWRDPCKRNWLVLGACACVILLPFIHGVPLAIGVSVAILVCGWRARLGSRDWFGACVVLVPVGLVASFTLNPSARAAVDSVLHGRRNATKAYWVTLLNTIPAKTTERDKSQGVGNSGFDQMKESSREAGEVARRIRGIPTKDVDQELIAYALKMADCADKMSNLLSRAKYLESDGKMLDDLGNSWSSMLESFFRTLAGDPLGKINEFNSEKSRVVQKARSLEAEGESLKQEAASLASEEAVLRAKLTERYGIQF